LLGELGHIEACFSWMRGTRVGRKLFPKLRLMQENGVDFVDSKLVRFLVTGRLPGERGFRNRLLAARTRVGGTRAWRGLAFFASGAAAGVAFAGGYVRPVGRNALAVGGRAWGKTRETTVEARKQLLGALRRGVMISLQKAAAARQMLRWACFFARHGDRDAAERRGAAVEVTNSAPLARRRKPPRSTA
jgi:hypothetical protein